ncbi:MAG: hypothetical protein IJK98_07375 [Clostridia bacterium]|nr:hypothetical protein [Clostridia bacterium]
MRRIPRKTLLTIFIISCVLSVASLIVMFTVGSDGKDSVLYVILMVFFGIVVLPIGFTGFILNIKKILIGLIAPIPVLSYLIENVKGFVYGVKALICIIKREEELVIGSPDNDEDAAEQ